ncbi:uncharacterized protein EI97DRAFT_175371 [Westerdykella ornata]|uniref:protein O-GlcNAc transferase n=1 Tax=Westerdykella ornata TaxID=318751 RepID=A0A6A6JT12_WESOR|nr:uncharacterized protein EI97DRAFT_175371 [Westerdykella ornata]KAF2279405.1 hypothetical protein EI97DRAFT_175371 [Westerdykella ornata]
MITNNRDYSPSNLPLIPSSPQLGPKEAPFSLPTITEIISPLNHDGSGQDSRQYAPHPLSTTEAYLRPSQRFKGGGDLKPPEHMLRRKTPSGILPAAYDGTSVEQTARPHATKHILLDATTAGTGEPYRQRQELPLRSAPIDHLAPGPQYQSPDWSPSLYFETGSGRVSGHPYKPTYDAHQYTGQWVPQDSVLYPNPPLQYAFQYAPQSFPYGPTGLGAMEPFRNLGPTVSNVQVPYGPYWHDGTYRPYEPAALRQPHYYTPLNSNQLNSPFYTAQNPWIGQSNGPAPLQQTVQSPSAFWGLSALPPLSSPPFIPPLHEQSSLVSSGSPQLAFAQFPRPQDTQTKERVFSWAHTVYIDLLKYLQATRKVNPKGQQPRPHVYPKPPRQSALSDSAFANSSNGGDMTPTIRRDSIRYGESGPRIDRVDSIATKMSEGFGLHPQGNYQRSNSLHVYHPGPANINVNVGQALSHEAGNINPYPHGRPLARQLRRTSGTSIAGWNQIFQPEPLSTTAARALSMIEKFVEESNWTWRDGILLGGCLAYGLGDFQKAHAWYMRILETDPNHVEAISNLAATCLALKQVREAEAYWRRATELRPSYFEAVEHLVGLLCGDNRPREAVQLIEKVEAALKPTRRSSHPTSAGSEAQSVSSDRPFFENEVGSDAGRSEFALHSDQPGFGSSGYNIPGSENGRILALVHAKGNLLYGMGDNAGAAEAFETAILIGAGRHSYKSDGIQGLIKHILSVVGYNANERSPGGGLVPPSNDPVLLPPQHALHTASLCFPPKGELPGLRYVAEGVAWKAAVSTTSNSLLSLAKIFQDGMAVNSPRASAYHSIYGVREILALYYLSFSLQQSPSTANNVGILLASVQQSARSRYVSRPDDQQSLGIPGLVPGSGVALALAYYNYGLLIDSRHAHLYTNLGSLLKDIGQLDVAISMYENAVRCDGNFDIALANLANAVKDKGRISDAIGYYRRAVQANPDFAEAVCGLANALNSVCDWRERGGIANDGGSRDRWHVDANGMLLDARLPGASSSGWIKRVVDLVEKQLIEGEVWGRGIMDDAFLTSILRPLVIGSGRGNEDDIQARTETLQRTIALWRDQRWEGARLMRLYERAIRRLGWQWYHDRKDHKERDAEAYQRPILPSALTVPAAPTVLPFHTFTCPMSAKQIRMISQRNGLRISCSTFKSPWMPRTVYPPPPPPMPVLNVGYVSSDFNNHPLAHLMQSAFGLHDPTRVKAFCYATTASDGSIHRQQIEREAPVFRDAHLWSPDQLVNRIVEDEIHILVNLNGYTRGARNEVFAARPAPIQMSFMGFAGTLGAEWCDYLLADHTSIPPATLRPWRRNVDMEDLLHEEDDDNDNWVYGENIIFCRDTFFCCDHKQSAPDARQQLGWEEEQERRWAMRKEIFPHLSDEVIIFGNFNQLYKIDPTTFRTWLRILERVPKAVLWLLRFPDLGETNLRRQALQWASPDVANRIIFTDVAPKHQHISRARVCDLFLDTPECNAHTTAADVVWSGTPLLTLPRYEYKMCSRMASSILKGALPKNEEGTRAAKDLIASNEEEYEDMAVRLGTSCQYVGHRLQGRLGMLRKLLYESRTTSALFDTRRWVRDLEEAYSIAWSRWEEGKGGDIWLEPRRS